MKQVLGRLARVGLLGLVALVLAGCAATGPRFSEVQESFPAIKPGHGRLMVYRSGGLGPAIQPDVRLNGDVVGKMQPEGFFFVDRPTGRYTVSARTEIESSVDVDLTDGATVYVETLITMGLFVGQPRLSLQSETMARPKLTALAYTGSIPLVAGRPGAGASAALVPPGGIPSGPGPAAPPPRVGGRVTMDDLSGLLPAQR